MQYTPLICAALSALALVAMALFFLAVAASDDDTGAA